MKTYKGSQKFSHIKALLKKSSMELSRVCLKGKWSLEVTSSRRAQLSSGTMRSYNFYISKRVDKLNHFISSCTVDCFDLFNCGVDFRGFLGSDGHGDKENSLPSSGSSSRRWDPQVQRPLARHLAQHHGRNPPNKWEARFALVRLYTSAHISEGGAGTPRQEITESGGRLFLSHFL